MSLDRGPALIGDLERDARHLADGEKTSEEQFRRTMGRVGLLLCDVARNSITNEEAREIAVIEAERVAGEKVSNHIVVCRGSSGSPTSWRGAAMLALSRSPWAVTILIVILLLLYHPPGLFSKLIAP
jgi:hypothetical protein